MLVPTEFVSLLNRHHSTFSGEAENEAGDSMLLCIKPRIRSDPKESAERLLGEWLGYMVAGVLGIPTPTIYLVDLDEPFIDSTQGILHDVLPGPALGVTWQEGYSSPFLPSNDQIVNGETISGAAVLDTLMYNNDRDGNILALPVAAASKFRLCFIDNGWIAWAAFSPQEKAPPPQSPRGMVRELAADVEVFNEFVFAGSTLSSTHVHKRIAEAPIEAWEHLDSVASLLVKEFEWRSSQLPTVAASLAARFPCLMAA
jgi:hypothetical protein